MTRRWTAALLAVGLPAAVALLCQDFPPEFSRARSGDVLQIDPRHYLLELENARVRVLRARLGPDVAVPMHDDRSAMIVAVSEVHIRFTRPDKRTFDLHMAAGEIRWGYADTHSIRNLIDRPAEYLIIELKK
jgi:hypothetical protein